MHRQTMALCAALSAGLALAITPGTSTALTLYGVESAKFRWAPASGPVSYYRVYVSTNGSEPKRYGKATGNEAVVLAEFGQTISVSVVAVSSSSGSFVEGPFSNSSEDVLFLDETGPGPGPDPEPTPEPDPGPGPGPGSQELTAPADFNADGRSDLLVQNVATGALRLWSMNGTQIVRDDPFFTGPAEPIVAIGDFDGDGTADVLYYLDRSSKLRFYLTGNGTGSLPLDTGWHVATSGDYDGDGRADLLVRNPNTSKVAIWLLDGSDLIEVINIFDLDASWEIRTGDFDADGTDDLVVDQSGQLMGVVLMTNGAPTSFNSLEEMGSGWHIADVADLDADGRDDLVFRHTQGAVFVWLMAGSEIVDSGELGSMGTEWEIVGLIDLDGNFASDLVWLKSDGRVYAGLLNGLNLVSHGSITTINANWVFVNPR